MRVHLGYLSVRPPPLNKFPAQLKAAVECWPNLQTVFFAPAQYHESTFVDTLPLLLRLSALRDLTVNGACANDALASVLVQLRGIESLEIQSPGRAILQFLPDWLAALRPTLRKLHLTVPTHPVTIRGAEKLTYHTSLGKLRVSHTWGPALVYPPPARSDIVRPWSILFPHRR